MHVYPGASWVCLALRNCHGFPLCWIFFFFWKEWLGMAHHPLPACGPGQIFRSSSGKHSPHRGESMTTAGEENAQPYWMGVRERKRKREKNCLSAKMGDKGSSGFCTGTCPEAFLWSFNLLWHASLFPQRSKRGLCGHLTIRKKVLLVAVLTRGTLIRFRPSALWSLLTGKAIFLTFIRRLVCLYHIVLLYRGVFSP